MRVLFRLLALAVATIGVARHAQATAGANG